MKMSAYEKETIVSYNKADSVANISSYDKEMIKRFKDYAAKYPECAEVLEEDENGYLSGTILKNRLSILFKAPRTFSQDEKVELLRRLSK